MVLLDLMLPGLTGEEVLPHIENIPVIVLSAKVDVQDKVKLLLDGAADYMTKPFQCLPVPFSFLSEPALFHLRKT